MTPSRLAAGVPFELAVVPLDRADHGSYAWSDDLPAAQAGELGAGD